MGAAHLGGKSREWRVTGSGLGLVFVYIANIYHGIMHSLLATSQARQLPGGFMPD